MREVVQTAQFKKDLSDIATTPTPGQLVLVRTGSHSELFD
jgi:mRNA-degrading endonuclease YafQ of YafQ-DinJ toxin-antitoxin module